MNYQNFKDKFEASGLTQSAYAKKTGMSPSMVSYYLSRARKELDPSPSFSKLEVINKANKVIRIKTSSGLEIEIPL